MDEYAAARQAYDDAGHAPGKPAGADWWGRICHAHRVAYPTSEGMGPHFEMAHEEPAGYYRREAA